MQIHDYQAKQILKSYGLLVLPFEIVASPEEVPSALKKLGSLPVVIKPQVHGGTKESRVCRTVAEAKLYATCIIGRRTGPFQRAVHLLLLTKEENFQRQHELSFSIDRKRASYLLVLNGRKIFFTSKNDLVIGGEPFAFEFAKMAQVFLDCDLEEMQILLGETADQKLAVSEALMTVDDQALFRQRHLAVLKDSSQSFRSELGAAKWGFFCKSGGGEIGCIVSGEGIGEAIFDQLAYLESPAGLLISIGNDFSKRALIAALNLIASKSKVILVNLFAERVSTRMAACALIAAVSELRLKLPIVVRLEGEGKSEADRLFLQRTPPFYVARTLEEAICKASEEHFKSEVIVEEAR